MRWHGPHHVAVKSTTTWTGNGRELGTCGGASERLRGCTAGPRQRSPATEPGEPGRQAGVCTQEVAGSAAAGTRRLTMLRHQLLARVGQRLGEVSLGGELGDHRVKVRGGCSCDRVQVLGRRGEEGCFLLVLEDKKMRLRHASRVACGTQQSYLIVLKDPNQPLSYFWLMFLSRQNQEEASSKGRPGHPRRRHPCRRPRRRRPCRPCHPCRPCRHPCRLRPY